MRYPRRVAPSPKKRQDPNGYYGDWYCDASSRSDCDKQECPSWRNEFKYNEPRCDYAGAWVPIFYYYQGETYVPPGCTNHAASG